MRRQVRTICARNLQVLTRTRQKECPESEAMTELNGTSERFFEPVPGLVSNMWYRMLFDQSELPISKIPPTDSPTVRPGRNP